MSKPLHLLIITVTLYLIITTLYLQMCCITTLYFAIVLFT